MKTMRAVLGFVVVAGLAACAGEIRDETVNLPNAAITLSTTADIDRIRPGQLVPMTVDIDSITLVEPAVAPPPEHVADAAYLVFTLDDESSTPLLVTAETEVDVEIPPSTTAGPHRVICRVHAHDGMPTDTAAELDINVEITNANVATTAPAPAPAPVY